MCPPTIRSGTNHKLRRYQVRAYSALFPKARVLSLVLFWCMAHNLNDLKAVNGVSQHPTNDVDIERRLTIFPDHLAGSGSIVVSRFQIVRGDREGVLGEIMER